MSQLEEIKKQRLAGVKADLAKYGIADTTEVIYNPTYEELFAEEQLPSSKDSNVASPPNSTPSTL